MSKPRSAIADWLVYLAIRLVVMCLQMLPFSWSCQLARGMAWLLYRVNRRHREVARDNLRHAYAGMLSEAEIDRTVRQTYHHFTRMMMEIVHLPRRLHVRNWRRYVKLPGVPTMVQALLSDKPLMIVTGHFGNWEVAGYVLGLLGFRTYAVARPLDNPHLDRFMRQFREKTGQKLLAKSGDFDKMQEILASGGVIATLADQDAGLRGLYVDFFGRPASTHKAIALMSLEYQVPLIVSVVTNLGKPMQYGIESLDFIEPAEYANRPDAVKAMTQRFTSALEQGIRRAPEQYFWLHRRWKHQPAAKRRVA